MVRLGRQAEQDFADILRWTARSFGPAQAQAYADTMRTALAALHAGPDVAGAKARDDILAGLRTLHVARQGRKGSHFVLFRVGEAQSIDVLRLLHERMDTARHLPE